MSLIARALERRVFSSTVVSGDGRIPSNGESGVVHAGEPVNETTALNLVAFYACVRLLADTIASLPWHAYRDRGGVRELVDPQPTLLTSPHPGDTGDETDFDFKHTGMVSLAMRGNFYGLVQRRDRLEYPIDVMPLHPDWVWRRRERGRVVTSVWGEEVPNADVVHIRGFTPPGAVEGLSPIGVARHAIGLGLATQRYGSLWFSEGSAPSGLLESDQDLSPEQALRNQEMWVRTHGGRRLPAVMTGGLKYKPITVSPEESQFLGTRAFSMTEMAMLVGVPPYLIGDVQKSTSYGRGIEQQSIGFVTYNLRSWLTRVERSMSLLIPRGQYVKFAVEGLLRGDIKSRYESYRVGLQEGFLNPDEVRSLEDRPPIPGGDGQKFRQPLNQGPLGRDPDADGPDDTDVEDDDDDE